MPWSRLMNRSIDLLEDAGARERQRVPHESPRLSLRHRRTATACPLFIARAREAAARSAPAPVRVQPIAGSDYRPAPADGFEDQPTGTDVITDRALIRRHFPYLDRRDGRARSTRGAAAGSAASSSACICWSARARRACGSSRDAWSASIRRGGRVRAVTVGTHGGQQTIATPRFVNAAGPFVKPWRRLLGVDLPVFCERHTKLAFNDVLGAVPRHAPMMIWTDPGATPVVRGGARRAGQFTGAPAPARGIPRRRPWTAGGRRRESGRAADLDLRRRSRSSRRSPIVVRPAYPEILRSRDVTDRAGA